ncbi:hypothetical protein C8R47DRAFT_1062567 [Mycena vitilis]|nr:hypothetical protein C8R47DRAFT_1062567 [Mycena vitilis]
MNSDDRSVNRAPQIMKQATDYQERICSARTTDGARCSGIRGAATCEFTAAATSVSMNGVSGRKGSGRNCIGATGVAGSESFSSHSVLSSSTSDPVSDEGLGLDAPVAGDQTEANSMGICDNETAVVCGWRLREGFAQHARSLVGAPWHWGEIVNGMDIGLVQVHRAVSEGATGLGGSQFVRSFRGAAAIGLGGSQFGRSLRDEEAMRLGGIGRSCRAAVAMGLGGLGRGSDAAFRRKLRNEVTEGRRRGASETAGEEEDVLERVGGKGVGYDGSDLVVGDLVFFLSSLISARDAPEDDAEGIEKVPDDEGDAGIRTMVGKWLGEGHDVNLAALQWVDRGSKIRGRQIWVGSPSGFAVSTLQVVFETVVTAVISISEGSHKFEVFLCNSFRE